MPLSSANYGHYTPSSSDLCKIAVTLNPGEVLTYDENHHKVIRNIKTTYENLNLIVGTVSDHILEIDGQEISLRELCGKNAAVTFMVTKGRGDGKS